MKIKSKKNRKKRYVILILVLAALAVGVYFIVFFLGHKATPKTTGVNINLDPPTKNQQTQGSDAKENFLNNGAGTTDTNQSSGAKDTRVIITRASQTDDGTLEVGSIVQTSDQTGQCTTTLTKDGKTVSRVGSVISQSSYIACEDVSIGRDALTSGTWNLTVSYSSASYKGSQSQEVIIT